ncbi:hypothetical protein PVK06_028354 [Gossypium arboreum]|uniref:Uncharacterized protein n=1 Tax=Gossypium arboreum TaxID=29729 RepID=A0ABR0P2T7_GOSAR|nr:hypothetical protein PVK06_028354 [Gossypium arboreum]
MGVQVGKEFRGCNVDILLLLTPRELYVEFAEADGVGPSSAPLRLMWELKLKQEVILYGCVVGSLACYKALTMMSLTRLWVDVLQFSA